LKNVRENPRINLFFARPSATTEQLSQVPKSNTPVKPLVKTQALVAK
jgi:hypothetical protein